MLQALGLGEFLPVNAVVVGIVRDGAHGLRALA